MRKSILMFLAGMAAFALLSWGVAVLDAQPQAVAAESQGALKDDPELGFVPHPAFPQHNQLGMVGMDVLLIKPVTVRRIVFIGDSTLYDPRYVDFPEILAAQYNRLGRCEFINASFQGFDVMRTYVRYERDVLPLNPDVVFVMTGGVDWSVRRPSIGLPVYAAAAQAMADLADEHNHRLVMTAPPITTDEAVAPVVPRWATANYARDLEAYFSAQHAALVASGADVLPYPLLDWGADDFRNSTHLSEQGHRKMADWLDSHLIVEMCD